MAYKFYFILSLCFFMLGCESNFNNNLIDEQVDSNEEFDVQEEDQFNYYYQSGYQLLGKGSFQEAINELNHAQKLKPTDPNLNYALGYCYSAIGQDSIAIVFFSGAIRENKSHSGAFFSRGVSFHLLKQDSLAIIDYNQSIAINPSFREVYYNRAISLLALGKKNEACTDLNYAYNLGDMNSSRLIQQYCNKK